MKTIRILLIFLVIMLSSCYTAKEGCQSGYHKVTRYDASNGIQVTIYDEWVECKHDSTQYIY